MGPQLAQSQSQDTWHLFESSTLARGMREVERLLKAPYEGSKDRQ